MFVVVGELIGDARDARVDVAAAERLVVDVLADRGLHERRAGEIDRALSFTITVSSHIAGT